MRVSLVRSVSLFTLAAAAISAQATDAYSNLGASPNVYLNNAGYFINSVFTAGSQFTATASGTLSGFQVAMNDYQSTGPIGYTLSLYADNGSNDLGTLLGTYAGTSTGIDYVSGTSTALSSVSAGGPAVTITSGGVYWLIASSNQILIWNKSNSANGLNYGGVPNRTAAFSVQVADAPAAPAPLAALPFALGLLKRRRKA